MNWEPPAIPDQPASQPPQPKRFLGASVSVWVLIVAVVALLVGVSAVSDGESTSSSSSGGLSARRQAYKSTVDALVADGDCRSLQDRFDDWADGNEEYPAGSDRARDFLWGMGYADDAMRRIGCYG